MLDQVRGSDDWLTVKAYRGDGAALLAFDVTRREALDDLAGFAVRAREPGGQWKQLANRLSFDDAITSGTTPAQRQWHPTSTAPIQKFRWAHYAVDVKPGQYEYEATAMLFRDKSRDSGRLEKGPVVNLKLDLHDDGHHAFEMGFTRGYLSSQAYAARFGNAPIRPDGKKTIDFDTSPFEKQYEWLGYHARKMLLEFLDECARNKSVVVDAFVYDLDEPDVIAAMLKIGSRLRVILDNSAHHNKPESAETAAHAAIAGSAGAARIKRGKFGRFSHQKAFIQRRKSDGAPLKVLTGSANFSVRGLYVQSNNVILMDDPQAAALFAEAFDLSWDGDVKRAAFANSDLASSWWEMGGPGMPRSWACFSPHKVGTVSLDDVAAEIKAADSSVFFAVMEMGGSGPVLEALKQQAAGDGVYTVGVSQRSSGALSVTSAGSPRGSIVPFAYLSSKVPQPFRKEWSGGAGQVIHHKFVVVDFNDSDPIVYTGSSNLAKGGEEQNGDNLLAIADRAVATQYAVEAVRLIDHYRFRAVMKNASSADPLRLRYRSEQWWKKFYKAGSTHEHERKLFIK